MSPARFLAAAVAIYGIAIAVCIVLYLVFRDSLEDLWEKLRLRVADRREPLRSRRARPLQFGAPHVWESAAVDLEAGWLRRPWQQLRVLRGRTAAVAAARTTLPGRLAWAALAVVAVAAAATVGATRDFGSSGGTGTGASKRLQAVPWRMSQLLRPPPGSSTHTPITHVRASLPKHAPANRTQASQTPVVSNLQPVSDHTAPVVTATVTAAASLTGGSPAPLQAPKPGSAPSPLRSP
jgi:hypothetical protein